MQNLLPAVAYYRFSAGGQQNEQSIEGQRRECEAFAAVHGYNIIEEYIDRHISGTTDKRPQLQRLLADAGQGRFQTVLAYKSDRIARNRYDSAVIKKQLRDNGVQIRYAAEAIIDGPEGIILDGLMEAMNEYYSAELSRKIKRGQRESAHKRQAAGGNIPFGLMLDAQKHYVPDPATAPIVQWIFSVYANGSTTADIMAMLNHKGIKNGRGRAWEKSSLSKLLRNEKYIGVFEYYDVRDEEAIEPIVDKETFRKVQERLAAGRRVGGQKTAKHTYTLSGVARCALCGAPLIGLSGTSRNGDRLYYYACGTHRRKGNDGCTKKSVKEPLLNKTVAEATAQLLLQPETIAAIAAQLSVLSTKSTPADAELKAAQAAYKDVSAKVNNLIAAIEEGQYSKALAARLRQLEAEQERLASQLKQMQAPKPKPTLEASRVEFFLHQLRPAAGEPESQYLQRLLEVFVEKVEVSERSLSITYTLAGSKKEAVDIPTASPPITKKIGTLSDSDSTAVAVGGDNSTAVEHSDPQITLSRDKIYLKISFAA